MLYTRVWVLGCRGRWKVQKQGILKMAHWVKLFLMTNPRWMVEGGHLPLQPGGRRRHLSLFAKVPRIQEVRTL